MTRVVKNRGAGAVAVAVDPAVAALWLLRGADGAGNGVGAGSDEHPLSRAKSGRAATARRGRRDRMHSFIGPPVFERNYDRRP
jgi:hypothetical protein